jgi:hypothetical protein
MNFKKFIIGESFDNSNVKAGDVLSFLQNIKPDIDNYDKKQIKSMMQDLVVKMRYLLSPKNDPQLTLVVQKIASAIMDDINDNNDFKDTIESSIFELESYFKNKKIALNKPTQISDPDSVSDPVLPKDLKKNAEVENLPPTENPSYIPPLAGSGENSINTI